MTDASEQNTGPSGGLVIIYTRTLTGAIQLGNNWLHTYSLIMFMMAASRDKA